MGGTRDSRPADQSPPRPLIKRPQRLGLDVYDLLLGDLMSAKIEPGSRLAVDALARQFGISQTPIREALARLEAEGLVAKTHLAGYRAAPLLDRKRFDEIYDVRLALEPQAASRVAMSGSDADITSIKAFCERMQDAPAKGPQYSRYAKLDAELHDMIMVAAGNQLMREMLARLQTHLHLFRLYFNARVTSEGSREHALIVARLAARDASGADKAMRAHIEGSRHRFGAFFNGK
jgi:DNA-binding GntR family transcriptional regulator